MTSPNFRNGAPPRWSDAVDGIVWLPRLAAKVRAHDAGTLGSYLLGQSPIDDEFLKAASPGAVERLRMWSLEMPVRRRTFMWVLELDDGYGRPGWMSAPVALFNAVLVPLIALARKVRPLKA